MRLCRLASLAVAIAIAAVPGVYAEPQSYEDLLKILQPKLDQLETYSADMEMSMNMGSMSMNFGGKMQGKGTKSATSVDIDMLGQQISTRTVVDGTGTAWMDMDMMGQRMVMKMNMEDMMEMSNEMMGGGLGNALGGGASQDPRRMLAMMNEMYEMTPAGMADIDGTKVYVVGGNLRDEVYGAANGETDDPDVDADAEDIPFDPATILGTMSGVRLYLGAEDGFVRKMEMVADDGSVTMTQNYKNVVINAPIDDSVFTFTPPDGVEVMDMTGMMQAAVDGSAGGGGDSGYNSKIKVGEIAPEFEGPAHGGGTLKLSEHRGKVVLLDFWASWCGPCVAEMPNVIAAYEKFHGKGFEIVGISLDDEKSALEEFLAENPGMKWRQVFDGKGWESAVGQLYGVEAIPFTLLLDGEGKVVARDLRGEQLEAEIAKLLDE